MSQLKNYLVVCRGDHEVWKKLSENDWDKIRFDFGLWTQPLKEQGLFQMGGSAIEDFRSVTRTNGSLNIENKKSSGPDAITGFFKIKASSLDHAAEIMSGLPEPHT